MWRKMLHLWVLALFASFVLFEASCAKKQIKTEEEAGAVGVAPEERKVEKPAGEEMGLTEAEKRAEEERRARMREMQMTQGLENEIRAFESEPIYFDFDKSDLKPPARAVLTKKGEWLRANPQFSLRIEGHCDDRGSDAYNLALGERRAAAAEKFLKELGISADRVSIMSYGEEKPADPGHNEEAWAKNRRDEFKLLMK